MYYIDGKLTQLFRDRAIIECGGIGYFALITAKTYEKLVSYGAFTASGELSDTTFRLYTYVRIKDQSVFETFGFATEAELSMFKLLQTVSGIGTRAALAILSALDVENVCSAIASENTKLISSAQGVGQKAAQKICIDLRSKLESFMLENGVGFAGTSENGNVTQKNVQADFGENKKMALDALVNLGYTKQQAQKALSSSTGNTVEELIRNALAKLF